MIANHQLPPRPWPTVAVALALSMSWAGAPGRGEGPSGDPSAGTIVLRRCPVEYEKNTLVASPFESVLGECLVDPGERVKAGQVLGRLWDGELRGEEKLRGAEAASDVEVRLSEARRAEAEAKLQRTAALVRRNAASQEELSQHRLEAATAALQVEDARHRRWLAKLQHDKAAAALQGRELLSPHDGVVDAVLKHKGEGLSARDPAFRVVNTDRLLVTCRVDVADLWRVHVGQTVRIFPEILGVNLPIEREEFAGKVTHIESRVAEQTRTTLIHVRAENRAGLLRAGIEARVEIDPAPPDAAPAPAREGQSRPATPPEVSP